MLVACGVCAAAEQDVSHMNASWRIRMSHVEHECVMLHINESFVAWSAVQFLFAFVPLLDKPFHMGISHVTHGWVMSHMNESCTAWSVAQLSWPMAWVPLLNESCHIWVLHFKDERVTSHSNASLQTRMIYVTTKWVTSHMNESRHLHMDRSCAALRAAQLSLHVAWAPLMIVSVSIRMCHVTYEWVTSYMHWSCASLSAVQLS